MTNFATQDLFIIDSLEIESQGEVIDLAPELIAEASNSSENSIQLGEATFTPSSSVTGLVADADANILDNTEAIPGVLSFEDNQFLSILTTSDLDIEAETLGINDTVEINLDSVVPDNVDIGDIGEIDYTFIQFLPSEDLTDEEGLSSLEVAELRASSRSVQIPSFDQEDIAFIANQAFIIAENGKAGRYFGKGLEAVGDGLTGGVVGAGVGGGIGVIGGPKGVAIGATIGGIGGALGGLFSSIGESIQENSEGDDTPDEEPEDQIPGTSKGDPHITTFDGLKYDFHAAGEFTLVKSLDDDFQVQVRTEHFNNGTTFNTAVATEVDGQRVTIYADQEKSLLIDGNVIELASSESFQVGDGLITRDLDTYTVTYDNNDASSDPDQLVVTLKEQKNSDNQFLNVEIFLSDEREDSVVGLLGNNNGIENDDLALQDGTVLSEPVDFEQVYTEYADGWRISQEDSLFDYAEGEDISTFTETNFFDNDNVIVGLDGDDIIAGRAGDDKITGQGGADTLTGGAGIDIFNYHKAFNDSVLASFDTITDLEIGTDKINGAYAVEASEVAQLGAVEILDEAGIQAVLTESEFITKGAAIFTFNAQTFIALNDEVAGYLAADDAIIEITGFVGSIDDLAIV